MLGVRMTKVGVPFLNKQKRRPFQGWGANQWSQDEDDDEMHLC